jgi:polar amino acid transport system substrate-binding protein
MTIGMLLISKSELYLVATLLISASAHTMTLTAAIGEYPPYTSAGDAEARLAEELVIASYQAVGYQVNLRRVPWKRAYEEVKSGKSDITFPWIKTPERDKFFLYSNEFLVTQEVFLYHVDANFSWSNLDDLKSYKIGATQGYAHVKLFQEAGVPIQVALDDLLNIDKLLKHRIDAFPIGEKVASYHLSASSSEFKEKISVHHLPLFKNQNFVLAGKAIPKRSKILLEKFNQGLAIIKQNGQFEKIMDKYK